MALTVKQSDMILRLLSHELSGERDVVKISMYLQDFQSTFGLEIPTWKRDLEDYLDRELYGNTALSVLKNWK